jgi:class 3 adenylate cyclase
LIEHDLFGKPLHTFPDHALAVSEEVVLADDRVERRLAAILSADVAGYSRLMDTDEVGTLRGLTERREVLDKLIADHRGCIVNTAGDSVLAEFRSAVEAVQCALEAQTALAETNANLPADKRICFRIGIHIGDVMVRGGELFGDGVNIAARLQSIAEPGGVCIGRDPRSGPQSLAERLYGSWRSDRQEHSRTDQSV